MRGPRIPAIESVGKRYGQLLVQSVTPSVGGSGAVVLYVCDCGAEGRTTLDRIRSGMTRSCGCLKVKVAREKATKHGESKAGNPSSEYRVWWAIKQRCLNSNNISYQHYGARGIAVCSRWLHSFENFLADMGRRPSPKHSIERENTNGNYEPDNCRWATVTEQARNKRTNVRLTHNGRTQILSDWAREIDLPVRALSSRLINGWTVARALTEPRHQEFYRNGR